MPTSQALPSSNQRLHLSRALSKLGICSRTQAEERIRAGQIEVNGVMERDPRRWVELGRDRIAIADHRASDPKTTEPKPTASEPRHLGHHHFLLHKPKGVVTTRSDELGRAGVYDLLHTLLPPEHRSLWMFPVGRLDRDSEGLLLFTTDGALAERLTDPSQHIPKTYRVTLNVRPDDEALERLRQGIELEPGDGKPTLPATVERESNRVCRIVLHEGRNRQIRRMFRAVGCKVTRLVRIAIGGLEASELKAGEGRLLTRDDLERMLG